MKKQELIESIIRQNDVLIGMLKDDDDLLTAKEAAEILRCSPTTILRMAKDNQIEAVRIRYNVCFRKSVVKEFISQGGIPA